MLTQEQLLNIGKVIADQVEDTDFASQNEESQRILWLRIRQANTRNQEIKGISQVGDWYAPFASYFQPTAKINFLPLGKVDVAQLWNEWEEEEHHTICKCSNLNPLHGQGAMGQPYALDAERGRWIPDEKVPLRPCALCPNAPFNPFGITEDMFLPPLLNDNGDPMGRKCRSGRIWGGLLLVNPDLPPSESNCILCGLIASSTVFSGEVRNKMRDSWESITGNLKMYHIPMFAANLSVATKEIQTPKGSAYIPSFTIDGVYQELIEPLRALAQRMEPQLALKDVTVPIDEPLLME